MSERAGGLLLIALFVLVGAVAWAVQLGPELDVDTGPLAALPLEIDGWRGFELPLESGVEQILRADFNVQRSYVHTLGEPIWLYIGYYGTERGGMPEHTPAACYRAHGWRVEERRTIAVAPARGLRVNEYLVEKDGERELVHFWFRSHRRTGILGDAQRMVDHLLGRLLDGRADGALVRVSAPVEPDDLEAVRSRLIDFAVRLDQELDGHWPSESARREPVRVGSVRSDPSRDAAAGGLPQG